MANPLQELAQRKEIEADFRLNSHVLRIGGYSAAGFGIGLVTALFFMRHRALSTALYCSGIGAGYALCEFGQDWNLHKQYRYAKQQVLQNIQPGSAVNIIPEKKI